MQPFYIGAYTHNADLFCCDCMGEWAEDEIIESGESPLNITDIIYKYAAPYDVGVYAYRSEALLNKLAELWGFERENEYSFDSDDFPKVVFMDFLDDREYCGKCGTVI